MEEKKDLQQIINHILTAWKNLYTFINKIKDPFNINKNIFIQSLCVMNNVINTLLLYLNKGTDISILHADLIKINNKIVKYEKMYYN